MENLLAIENLTVIRFPASGVQIPVVRNIKLEIAKNEVFCLVGESGSGKTTIALSIMKLLPVSFRVTAGQIILDGNDLLNMNEAEIRKVRGKRIGMIFQEPASYLNPLLTSGEQIRESVTGPTLNKEKIDRAKKTLDEVGLSSRVYSTYPHQLSGGMQQRVMIAMAVVNEPELLIADEPTTALDVITTFQIIRLLDHLREKHNLGILFITHDFSLALETADRIGIIYRGEILETFKPGTGPVHPYSKGLLESMVNKYKKGERIKEIASKF